jgi:hypothetical protein
MIIQDVDSLETTLPPLEEIVPNLNNRYGLQLKSNFNVDEVKEMVADVGKRLLQYQFAFFYEYQLELPKGSYEVIHEHLKGFENKINGTTDDFHRFIFRVKVPEIVNQYKKENKGPAKLENIDWNFAISFLNVFEMKNFGYINTEDLAFTDPAASFFGRSVVALLVQDYVRFNQPALASRNFNLIKCDEPKLAKSAEDIIKKQRDLCLNRNETIELLRGIKCRKTGKDLTVLLDKDYDYFTA